MRPARPATLAAVALAAVALVAGCGPAASPTPVALPADLPTDHVLLLVEEYGGLMGWQDASTPRRFALTANGTLTSVDVTVGGLLPAIRETALPPDALASAWAAIHAAGVARDGKLDIEGLFDAQSTFFTVDDGARATTLQVYGLSPTGDVAGPDVPVPSGDVLARRAALDLLAELAALATGGRVEAPRLAIYVAPAGDGLGPDVPWTGSLDLATAGAPVTTPGFDRCAVVDGAEAAAMAATARALPPDAGVEQDGVRWVVRFRPLFTGEPDPEGCAPA